MKMMITAIVETIGPIAFSTNEENKIATTLMHTVFLFKGECHYVWNHCINK